jgi:hypothetical protein
MRPVSPSRPIGGAGGGGDGEGPDDPRHDQADSAGEAPVTIRRPFLPASRDHAKGQTMQDDHHPIGRTSRDAATGPTSRPASRPASQPRRQIWDIEDDGDAAPTSRPLNADGPPEDLPPVRRAPRVSRPEAQVSREPSAPPAAPDAEDMASRARRALAAAERTASERGISRPRYLEEGGANDSAKTRVLGFHAPDLEMDPISAVAHKQSGSVRYPAGWLVVVDGPGRGAYFAVTMSVSSIGRGADQAISLNFGDASISRQNHAAIAYDAEQNRFFLGHGNKSNIVRRNGQPVLATEELTDGDVIRIGKTSLRFVALCGDDFTWGDIDDEDGYADE